jgi:hypothetical protein
LVALLMCLDRKSEAEPASAQSVAILVPCAARARAWIPALAEALRNDLGVAATLVTSGGVAPTPAMSLPERFERLMLKSPGDFGRLVDVSAVALESLSPRPALIIDATGQEGFAADAPVLAPALNGRGLESIVSVLWSGQPPQLGVRLAAGQGSNIIHAARIAVPDRELTTRALDAVFRRLVALLVEASAHLLNGKPLPALPEGTLSPPPPLAGCDLWSQAARGYVPKAFRQFAKPLLRFNDWRVGYRRRIEPARFPEKLDLRPETFTLLPSPRSRFYADPFLFEKDGVTYLFFEDYDYARGKARISYVTLGANSASQPAVALERPYHVSYPQLFAHEGRVFMIPETSGNRAVELYEATAFPQGWSLRATLLADTDADDATVHRWGGRWWMFATVVAHGGSSWDSVSVFWADALEGPWRPHPMNPVKYDVTAARPAGAMIESAGRLLRPAQDSSKGYGSALAWCEVVELSETAFAERTIARQACAAGSGYHGLHTYNRSASFEAVDFALSRLR